MLDQNFERTFRYVLKREMRGVSEMELSEMTGISAVTISKYLHGKSIPNGRNIRKIAMALGCTPNDLMWVDEEEMLRLESLYL